MADERPAETIRFVRVETAGGPAWGRIADGEVFALVGRPELDARTTTGSLGPLDKLELLAPAEPTKIVCVGRNYVAHAAEHGAEVPSEPLLFLKPPSSVIGPGAPIVLPELSTQVEHEAEVGLVIGTRCRRVSEQEAWRYVLGVICANDVTARDLQRSDNQWTRGKGFDTFCPLGPWIETGLTEQQVCRLQLTCRVNGEVRQRGETSRMVFRPSALIAYITQVMTLEAGDVVLTGTPSGVGPLRAGDSVSVAVEGVGELVNPVV
jgi:2-keto-4-pentenoate hydratase/2-oxohepta-3-ene-1,7-dioic acid hydratase in catechol pathway